MKLNLLILLAGLFLAHITSAEDVGKLKPGVDAGRVLFLGNSITRHPPAPQIGWTSDWGMAASALEKDYVHLVAAGVEKLAGKKPEIQFANIADFERNLATFDLNGKLKENLEFKPTLVIVAIGENVAGLGNDEAKAQYKTAFTKLLTVLKNNGQPTLIVRSCFWADPAKDGIMQEACTAAGGIFVDLKGLSKDESNYARSERKWDHAGVAMHPGDKGMQAIADAILTALKSDGK